MHKNIFIIIILSSIFLMCSSPRIIVDDVNNTTSEDSAKEFLSKLNALESTYSVLIFTDGFLENQNIRIKNGNTIIFDEILETDRVLGFADAVRINNRENVLVVNTNTNYTFQLPVEKNSKYKYIYVSKVVEEDKNYTVKYSNTLRSFY